MYNFSRSSSVSSTVLSVYSTRIRRDTALGSRSVRAFLRLHTLCVILALLFPLRKIAGRRACFSSRRRAIFPIKIVRAQKKYFDTIADVQFSRPTVSSRIVGYRGHAPSPCPLPILPSQGNRPSHPDTFGPRSITIFTYFSIVSLRKYYF